MKAGIVASGSNQILTHGYVDGNIHLTMPIMDIEERRRYQREWLAARRSKWFRDKICADCGASEGLELDHVDPSKKVTHRIWSWSKERRDEELKKCVARCESCHRKRSSEQLRKLLTKPWVHGRVVTYLGHGCRCDECKARYKIHRRWQYEKNGC